MGLTARKRETLDAIFKKKGYTDYKWIDPQRIIVSQWVRMKCKFGCGGYGRIAACPPYTPSVAECEQFFSEYSDAVILHFEGTSLKIAMPGPPESTPNWSNWSGRSFWQVTNGPFY